MADIYGYTGEFERTNILEKMDDLETRLLDEQAKKPEDRNPDREFELLYARMIAGLKLNTGSKLY